MDGVYLDEILEDLNFNNLEEELKVSWEETEQKEKDRVEIPTTEYASEEKLNITYQYCEALEERLAGLEKLVRDQGVTISRLKSEVRQTKQNSESLDYEYRYNKYSEEQ